MNEYERIAWALGDFAGWGMLVMVLGGFVGILVACMWIAGRLLPPRHERRFDNLARNTRGRRAMARGVR